MGWMCQKPQGWIAGPQLSHDTEKNKPLHATECSYGRKLVCLFWMLFECVLPPKRTMRHNHRMMWLTWPNMRRYLDHMQMIIGATKKSENTKMKTLFLTFFFLDELTKTPHFQPVFNQMWLYIFAKWPKSITRSNILNFPISLLICIFV